MTNAGALKRLAPGFLIFVLFAGVAWWALPAKLEAQPDCVSAQWEGRYSPSREWCDLGSHRNCSGVGISCPPAV